MLVIRRAIPDVSDFFVNVPFHAPAYGRIELSEVADLHRIADLRFAICDLTAVFFDAAISATISPASIKRGLTRTALSKPVSIINSEPKGTFDCFFFHQAELSNKFRFRARAAPRPVVSCDRSSAPYQLRSHCLSLDCSRQSTNKCENAQRKLLCPLEKLAFSHWDNRNSQIAN